MTRTQSTKYKMLLYCLEVLKGRKDCKTARELLLKEIRKFELRIHT